MNWFLPTLFIYDTYSIGLIKVLKEHEINIPKIFSYGTIRCEWTYKYDSYIKFEDKYFIDSILKMNTENDIKPVIDFSNTDLTEQNLENSFCNWFLDKCQEYNCEIIIGADILFDYVKNKYPDIKLISSVYKPMDLFQNDEDNFDKELNYYKNLLTKYDKVMVRPEFVKYIEQGTAVFENMEKLVIITNSACRNNCAHFRECRDFQNNEYTCIRPFEKKKYGQDKYFENISMLDNDQIKFLSQMGIKNFMLKDNKQPLLFLYTLFNNCLFERYEDFQKISSEVKEQLIENLKDKSFTSGMQCNFFSAQYLGHVTINRV